MPSSCWPLRRTSRQSRGREPEIGNAVREAGPARPPLCLGLSDLSVHPVMPHGLQSTGLGVRPWLCHSLGERAPSLSLAFLIWKMGTTNPSCGPGKGAGRALSAAWPQEVLGKWQQGLYQGWGGGDAGAQGMGHRELRLGPGISLWGALPPAFPSLRGTQGWQPPTPLTIGAAPGPRSPGRRPLKISLDTGPAQPPVPLQGVQDIADGVHQVSHVALALGEKLWSTGVGAGGRGSGGCQH